MLGVPAPIPPANAYCGDNIASFLQKYAISLRNVNNPISAQLESCPRETQCKDIDESYAKVQSSDISTTPLVEQPMKRLNLSLSNIRTVLNDP